MTEIENKDCQVALNGGRKRKKVKDKNRERGRKRKKVKHKNRKREREIRKREIRTEQKEKDAKREREREIKKEKDGDNKKGLCAFRVNRNISSCKKGPIRALHISLLFIPPPKSTF